MAETHCLMSVAPPPGRKRLWQEPHLNPTMLLMTSTAPSLEQATAIITWINAGAS